MKNSKSTVECTVKEARRADVGRGIVRLDPDVAEGLGLRTGDVIFVEGGRRTAGKLWPGREEDRGTGAVRIDGATRRNAGAGIDEKVKVGGVEAKPARGLTLAPVEPLRLVGAEEYLQKLLDGRAITRGDIIGIDVMSRRIELVAVAVSPSAGAVIIGDNTRIELSEKPAKEHQSAVPLVSYEDIGGLDEEVRKVREMIELPLKHPEVFQRLGVEPPKGVLLHGPPGTGKTLLARAVASETSATFLSLSGPEVMSKFHGQSEENIRNIFEEAEKNAPAIIFIDEIDSIAPKRDEVSGEVERRVVAQILALMDGLESRGKVVVIGATNRPNALDPALRRPGRFDREIEISIPDVNGRLEILQIHSRGMPLEKKVKLKELASMTHGFAGADMASLCREAGMRALRRALPDLDLDEPEIPSEVLEKLHVTRDDFMDAFREMNPSTLREVHIESPDVKWEDIGGLEEAKQQLREVVEYPLKFPNLFEHMGSRPPAGVLLSGPPGTGKTLLAKAVATESEVNFISVKGSEFFSKWVGESEKAVRETFRKARLSAPCIIFFDEMDAVAPTRSSGSCDSKVSERVVSQLLAELDGLERNKDVLVLAATNRVDMLDPALLRAGRFDRKVAIGMPDREARLAILRIHTRDHPMVKQVDLGLLADITDGYSGSDLAMLCSEASMAAIREYVTEGGKDVEADVQACKVYPKHFLAAFRERFPHTDVSALEKGAGGKGKGAGRAKDGAGKGGRDRQATDHTAPGDLEGMEVH